MPIFVINSQDCSARDSSTRHLMLSQHKRLLHVKKQSSKLMSLFKRNIRRLCKCGSHKSPSQGPQPLLYNTAGEPDYKSPGRQLIRVHHFFQKPKEGSGLMVYAVVASRTGVKMVGQEVEERRVRSILFYFMVTTAIVLLQQHSTQHFKPVFACLHTKENFLMFGTIFQIFRTFS